MMVLFHHSIRYVKYLRNISKLIQINENNKRFLCLAQIPNIKTEERIPIDFYGYRSKSKGINYLIKTVDKKLLLGNLLNKNLIEDIIQCIQIEGQINTSQALSALRGCNVLIQCTPEQRSKLANSLWKLFNIYNVQMNAFHYNTLLEIYIDSKYEFQPLDILNDMKKNSIQPNTDTYKNILKYYCMKGNMSEAMVVLQCMKDENHVLTADVFNSFIMGYGQANNHEKAINVLKTMEQINLTPTDETYTTLMCIFAAYNDIESIQKILYKCQAKGINLRNENLLNVIYTLIAYKHVDYVENMLNKLKRPISMEALKFLAKLIDIKQENVAMKILDYIYFDIKSNIMKFEYENFFINKLIYSDVSTEKIIKACKIFYHNNNQKIFSQAIIYAFKENKHALASSLLKEWKNKGYKLKPHFFWPFLVEFHKNHNIKGLLEYVKDMKETYDVVPCIETVAEYILPSLLSPSISTTFFLRQHGIPVETTRNALILYWLSGHKTKSPAAYITTHGAFYDDFMLKSKLKKSLINTHDIISYLKISQNLYTETMSGEKVKVSLDEKILDIMDFLQYNPTIISKIMEYLLKKNLSISDDTYEMLSMYERRDEEPQSVENLNEVKEVKDSLMMNRANEQINIDVNNVTSKALDSLNSFDATTLKNFLQLKTWKTANPNKINITIAKKLLNEYSREESNKILQKLIVEYPTCASCKLVLTYARNLISIGDINDAAELIKYTCQRIEIKELNLLENEAQLLLNEVALVGSDTMLYKFYDILSKHNYVKLSTNYLESLIMVHVNQGNVHKALEMAEMLSNKYKHIPALKELIKSVVLTKDANLLQYFINIATKTYGEEYILGELILCFLMNNFEEEAKKIIQLFCTSNYNFSIIGNVLEDYSFEWKILILDKLLDFTVDYPNTNRILLYEYLAEIYDKTNDYSNGINLWKRAQKEEVLKSYKFKKHLSLLLRHDEKTLPYNVKLNLFNKDQNEKKM